MKKRFNRPLTPLEALTAFTLHAGPSAGPRTIQMRGSFSPGLRRPCWLWQEKHDTAVRGRIWCDLWGHLKIDRYVEQGDIFTTVEVFSLGEIRRVVRRISPEALEGVMCSVPADDEQEACRNSDHTIYM